MLVILVPFINFSLAVERMVLILLGVVIAVLGFWAVSGEKSAQPGEVAPLAPQKPREPVITEKPTMPGHLGM